MPIRLPSQTRIDARDFQNGSYNFSVESVLGSTTPPGRLVVSVSSGYLLTTSLTDQPRREQNFEHIQQVDGSWIASGTVTIVLVNEPVVDGTIVIQNSSSEVVVVSIVTNSVALEKSQRSTLAANQPMLTFTPTTPGKPSFLILTIRPQHENAPVTLTTDATDLFQLATDSSPRFAPTITFNPSPVGSYVHVRYMADKRGSHTGQLLLTSDYEQSAVTLTGRSRGLLQTVLKFPHQSITNRGRIGLLALLIAGGLAFAVNSNSFFPNLSQTIITNQGRTRANSVRPALEKAEAILTKNKLLQPVRTPKTLVKNTKPTLSKQKEAVTRDSDSDLRIEQQPLVTSHVAIHAASVPKSSTDQSAINSIDERSDRKTVSVQSTQESDLERELNQTPPH